MATITDLTNVLATSLGIGPAPVTNAARALREAGLLPTGERGRHGGVAMTAEHAATLLLGFLGTDLPCKAPVAARLFGNLPAISGVFQKASGEHIIRTGHRIEDIPLGCGEGPGRSVLTRSLHGALADIIRRAALGGVTEFSLIRDLAAPLAWVRFPIVAPGQELCAGEIFYAPSNGADISETVRSSAFRLTASVNGAVLARLGEVLWEDAKTAVLADLSDAEAEATSDEERAHA